ncbi:MAG: glutathione synthase [Candidatus Protistobacter heckmanni]|nr:glutathione synthase [Candidatus Protistobacter heckmanni]
MRILFIADPLDGFKIYKDSTYAMMEEAARRGHALYFCEDTDLALSAGVVQCRRWRVELTGDKTAWHALSDEATEALSAFDAVLMRKDPPFDIEYVTATWMLSLAQSQGARVHNRPDAVRNHSEKLSIGEFPQFTAPTLVSRDARRLREFHAEHRDVIIKPLDGMGGMGIFRVGADGLNLGSIIETLGANGARTLMAQRYIPEIRDGDKRILLIAGKPVPYSLARVPMAGEVRGNLAAGGTGRAQPLSTRDREIAETLAPILWERGLFLVGLDVIGDYLTEINVTSPTCFREIADQTGFNVAGMFLDALEAC